jgi:hypothetical protein
LSSLLRFRNPSRSFELHSSTGSVLKSLKRAGNPFSSSPERGHSAAPLLYEPHDLCRLSESFTVPVRAHLYLFTSVDRSGFVRRVVQHTSPWHPKTAKNARRDRRLPRVGPSLPKWIKRSSKPVTPRRLPRTLWRRLSMARSMPSEV